MFFPERARIRRDQLVLEIGPGAFPDPRAHVYADKYPMDAAVDLAQFGGRRPQQTKRPVLRIPDGLASLPDMVFDYIICSHVFEHLTDSELVFLTNQMNRLAPRCYLEFPSYFYEYLYDFEVHKRVLTLHKGSIFTITKDELPCDPSAQCAFRRMRKHGLIPEKACADFFAEGAELSVPLTIVNVQHRTQFLSLIEEKYGKEYAPARRSLIARAYNKIIRHKRIARSVPMRLNARVNKLISPLTPDQVFGNTYNT
jgi:hypothetical protein